MIIRMSLLSAVLFAISGLCAQTTPVPATTQFWTLPHGTAVIDAGPRTYHFTVDYNTANATGEIIHRQRITGDYTRGLVNGEVIWNNVTSAEVNGATAPFPPAQKQDFMEGFRYRNDLGATMAPDFFKSFPPAAIMERNLVWDTGMFELFGQNYFDKLQLNVPLHIISDQNVEMPDLGTFHNHNVVLEYQGRSQRNGQDCALIDYRAFFNPLEIATGGMTLTGRSDYWGTIWVSLATKQIEYATLYEEVQGRMQLPGQDAPQPLSVFRIATFEPASAQ